MLRNLKWHKITTKLPTLTPFFFFLFSDTDTANESSWTEQRIDKT